MRNLRNEKDRLNIFRYHPKPTWSLILFHRSSQRYAACGCASSLTFSRSYEDEEECVTTITERAKKNKQVELDAVELSDDEKLTSDAYSRVPWMVYPKFRTTTNKRNLVFKNSLDIVSKRLDRRTIKAMISFLWFKTSKKNIFILQMKLELKDINLQKHFEFFNHSSKWGSNDVPKILFGKWVFELRLNLGRRSPYISQRSSKVINGS